MEKAVKKIFQVAVAILFVFSGCKTVYKILDYMPRETDVPGWVLVKWDRWKEGSSPAYETYARYDILEAGIEKYRSISENKGSLVDITIYRHGNPLQAYSLFSIERQQNRPTAHFDDYGYQSEKGFFFTINEFYVKLAGDNQNGRLRQELEKFKKIVDDKISARTRDFNLPKHMGLFSNTAGNTDLVYFHNGHPGVPFLDEVCVKTRNIGEKKLNIFFSKQESVSDAMKMLSDIQKETPDEYILAKEKQMTYMLRKKNEGFCMLSSFKNYIFGVLDADDINNGRALLEQLYREIQVTLRE